MGLTVCFLVLGSMQAYAAKESDMIQEKEINVPKEKDEFFQNLSDEECYQRQFWMPYFLIQEHIGAEEKEWEIAEYREAVSQWEKRESKEVTEELKRQWKQSALELQPEYKKEYQIDGVWKQIDSLANYEEFLQTQVSFSVKDCLQGLRNAVGMNVQMPKEEIQETEQKEPSVQETEKEEKQEEKHGSCRIKETYYEDLSAALEAVKDGETIYVVQDHEMKNSFISVTKARLRTFQNVKIFPEGGPRTVYMSDQNRLVFSSSSLSVGSKQHPSLTFDLRGTTVQKRNRLYCSAICGNKGSTLTFENCIFQNGDKMEHWMVHGEYGSITINQCRFVNCDSGVGVISNSSTDFAPKEITFKVKDSVFEEITDESGVHFSVFGADVHSEIYGNTFRNCRIGINGLRDNAATYLGNTKAVLHDNTYQNCYVGENFSQGPSFKPETFQVILSNENYDGWRSTAHNPNVGDLYAGWFSAGLCNLNANVEVNDCRYQNGIHGIATLDQGETTVNHTVLSGNRAQDSNSDQYSQKGKGGGLFLSKGSVIWNSGTIRENQADEGGGIFNQDGTVRQRGGNIAANQGKTGSGVYQNGTYQMEGTAVIEQANDVYLPTRRYLEVVQSLSADTAARVTPQDYQNGRTVVKVAYGSRKGSVEWERFQLTPKEAFCLRPGDYQDRKAGTTEDAVTVSSRYEIVYDKNTKALVEQLPELSEKYWYENAKISTQIPKWLDVPFLGWDEDKESKTAGYQPGETLKADRNQNMILYAIWEDRVSVQYDGNGAEKGTKKSEMISYEDCLKNQGYLIRKNKGYTEYQREKHTFAGWDKDSQTGAKEAEFLETMESPISYEELRKLAAYQRQDGQPSKEMARVDLYAIWDRAPDITAPDKEYFEGETVTGEELLTEVHSTDQEDGNLTEQVRIVRIEYAPGRVTEHGKADSETKVWKEGMPKEKLLDTWFLQLDKKDSPVMHQVVYQVKDSIGNITEVPCKVKIKYNEFPVIEAQDRYFTLQEAQSGKITEGVLKDQAISEGKVKAEDVEEGNLSAKLKLLDFHPEEFQKFTDSGYIMLNWYVQDSMGPDQKGKETVMPFLVYVVKDGEIPKAPKRQTVRFINEKYYRLNEDVDSDSMTAEEKEQHSKNGGLHVDSKWYQEEEYQTVIENAWSKNSGKSYRFTQEDARRAEAFVDAHGIGNSQDENALMRFANEFLK